MRKVKVIAFVGNIGAGKTTAAKRLMYYGYDRLRLADPLKRMLTHGLGIGTEYIDGNKKGDPCEELCGRTARHAMITLGTEWGRNLIHPNLWVTLLQKELEFRIAADKNKFVIDDVRFLNESCWVKGLDIIGVDAKLVRITRISDLEKIQHQSETEMDGIQEDWLVSNNSTLESFHRSIDEMLIMMKG